MTDDGRCMDVNIIFHDYSTHARYMRINSVEITDMSIMCNDGIGLYHIIVAHHGIITNNSICTYEVACSNLSIREQFSRLMN